MFFNSLHYVIFLPLVVAFYFLIPPRRRWVFLLAYRQQLEELSVLCRERGINLVFIIFPSHMDLQDKIVQYGLTEANKTFRKDLARFGLVYDFAWENEVTRNRELFKDPYHFDHQIEESIIRTVWNHESHNVRIYGSPTHDGGVMK